MNHLREMRVLIAEIGSTFSISQEAAKAIYMFDRHVGLDCYDVWHPNGGRFKSMPLMKQLARMHELLDKLVDYQAAEVGFYTMPLCEASVSDQHPLLAAEIGEHTSVRCYSAEIFFTQSLNLFGYFELFLDEKANEACGLFLVPFELSERIIGPGWTECGSDIDATVQTFLDGIPDLNVVYPLDEDEDQPPATDRSIPEQARSAGCALYGTILPIDAPPSSPQNGQWRCGQPVSERHEIGAVVEHDAIGKPVLACFGQGPQSGEIAGLHRR
jgi:hypothetical protein